MKRTIELDYLEHAGIFHLPSLGKDCVRLSSAVSSYFHVITTDVNTTVNLLMVEVQ